MGGNFAETAKRWVERQGRDLADAAGDAQAAQLSSLDDMRHGMSRAGVPRVTLDDMRALARAPRKEGAAPAARAAAPGAFARAKPANAAEAERQALIDRAYPFPATAAMLPMGRGTPTPGVFPAVIDINGVTREVSDEAFNRAVPEQMRPMLRRAEQLEYGKVDPLRFSRPGLHLNMRISDVGVTDPERLPGAMARRPAPGAAHREPVQTGGSSWVWAPPPFPPAPSGEVSHEVRAEPLAITNTTRPWHVFHPGAAVRVPFKNPDGTTRIVTVSLGTNGLTGPLNQQFGPPAFGVLDAQVGRDAARRTGATAGRR